MSNHIGDPPIHKFFTPAEIESEAVTNKVYAHLRKRDYSAHRAAFSAHIAAAATPPAPIRQIVS